MLVAAGVVTYAAAAWWSSRHLPWLALALAVAPFVWLAAAFALARPAAGGAWQRAGRWLPLLALCAALAAGWEPLLANVLLVYLAQQKRNFFLVLQRSCKGFLSILVAKIRKKERIALSYRS